MDQSLAIMLWQLCYGKISFIVLVPEATFLQLLLMVNPSMITFIFAVVTVDVVTDGDADAERGDRDKDDHLEVVGPQEDGEN